jgi:arylsulfatase A-like enzyme/HEAT repeat protein
MTEPRPSPWLAVLAGTLGGALAGAADAAATLVRGVGGVTGMHQVRLVLLAIGAGALAGTLLAALAGGLCGLLERRVGRARAFMLVAALLGAPVVIIDAFALFTGTKAARVPAHALISVVLALLGLAGLALLGRLFARALERRRVSSALGLLAVGIAVYGANRVVLPRLYPWFHNTLSFSLLVLAVLAARLVLRPPAGWLQSRGWALLAVVGAVAIFALELPTLLWSPIIRYAAHERTQLTALLLHVPLPRPRLATPRVAGRQEEVLEAPLPEGPHRPNADVVLVTIDALRADHVGAYGYGRNTTPHIDALARSGVRFERAYTQAPHTSFSVASMLTGKYYPTIARLAPGDEHDPITEVLRRYGWKTAAFYPPAVFFVDAHKLKAYQENNFRFEYVKFEYLDAWKRLDQIDAFFKSDHPAKTFLWLHLFEPHEPYDKRPGYEFGDSDIDRYDSEIAYTDAAVGKLIAYLDRTRPGAIIIVTADHGEEFDEHGGRYHGTSLYEEQVRVPLVVRVPGIPPHVVTGPVELIDLAPTILGLVDIPAPVRMRGTDLGAWLGVPPAPERRLPPCFAEVADKRMIVWGMEKLICEMNWGYCAYYDLAADPHERKNLAEQAPDKAARLKNRLDDWLDDHVRFEPQLVRGPANPDGSPVPRAIERGRLGDLLAANDLAAMLVSGSPLPARREAARLLVALPARAETRAALLSAMSADDEDVRNWAAVAAARLGDPGARQRIKDLVAGPQQPDHELRVQAALALARGKDPSGVPVLAEALGDCHENVLGCQLIILELGKLRDRRAVPALLAHLPEVQNRREMVEALGAIGDPSVAGALVERLETDEYVPVRVEAARALAKLGGPEARAGLEQSARSDHEPTVRAAAGDALTILNAPAPSPPPTRRDKAHSPRRAAGR